MRDDNSAPSVAMPSPDYQLFFSRLDQFFTTFKALEEFLSFIAPQALEFDAALQGRIMAAINEKLDRLPPATRKAFFEDLEVIRPALRADMADPDKARPNLTGVLSVIHPESIRILGLMIHGVATPSKHALLLRSLLPMAVGTFEVLIGQLAELILKERPGLLGSDTKEFSLDDLRRLGSVEEAFNEAVQERIDTMLLGGLEKWVKWFSKRGLDIDIRSLPIDWTVFVEVFQRRHIIVHNAGKVSKLYLEKMQALTEDLPELGSEPPIDPTYVQTALDNLVVTGALLAIQVERNLRRGRAPLHLSELLLEISRFLMSTSRWQAVETLCGAATSIGRVPESTRLELRCHAWLARKKQNGTSSIHAEVESWDTSSLDLYFQALRHSLLDKNDEAAIQLDAALRMNQITYSAVLDSPFFVEIAEKQILSMRVPEKQLPPE